VAGDKTKWSPFTLARESPAVEGRAISQCGVVNKFLTIFEDLMEVYLFGIQLGIE
jgi:hypothetical protein